MPRYVQVFESLRDENRPHAENRTERKEAGVLGPTKSRLGSNLAVLGLKLGRTGASLAPNLHLTCAELGPVGSNFGPTWAQLGSNMAQFGHVLGASWAWHAQRGPVWGHLAPKLGPRQAQCGQPGLTRTSKPKTSEIAVKTHVFSVSHWSRKTGSGWAQLGRKGPGPTSLSWPNWSPSWRQ